MTWVGVVSMLVGLLAIPVGMLDRQRWKLAIMLLACVLHIAAAYAYYIYVQTQSADTALYYFDSYNMAAIGFSPGTQAIILFVQAMKGIVGGTYLDYFMMFQVFGILGIALMLRSMQEVVRAFGVRWTHPMTVMAFVPGTYFWTSAIGKDSPLFLAAALASWSAMRLGSRWPWFAAALLLMVLVRPHVALIAAAALAMALVAGRGLPTYARIGALLFAAVCLVAVGSTVQSSLAIDLSSVGSVATYVDNQVNTYATASGAEDMASMSYLAKLLSLLYRPFFFDYNGIFSLIASLQNVLMVAATLILLRNWRAWVDIFLASLGMRFATMFLFGMILLLTVMYYNVGLGLRQREMFTPSLIFVVTVILCHLQSVRMTQPRSRSAVQPGAAPVVA